MDQNDWFIIKTIVKEKNLTAASEKLFVTQTALSYRINNIERELNIALLIRTSKGVVFTSQGMLVAEYAEEMLKKYAEMKNIVSSLDKVLRGTINLAVSPAFARYKLAPVLSAFRTKYPYVNIYIKTCLSSKGLELLMNDDVSISIIRGSHKPNCKAILLDEEPINLISKNKVDLNELPNLPYIMYETDISLERDILNWWRERYYQPPHTIMHINDSFTCRQLVANNLGYSILPSIGFDYSKQFDFHKVQLTKIDGTPLVRPTWLIYKPYTEKITAAKAFIQFLSTQLQSSYKI